MRNLNVIKPPTAAQVGAIRAVAETLLTGATAAQVAEHDAMMDRFSLAAAAAEAAGIYVDGDFIDRFLESEGAL